MSEKDDGLWLHQQHGDLVDKMLDKRASAEELATLDAIRAALDKWETDIHDAFARGRADAQAEHEQQAREAVLLDCGSSSCRFAPRPLTGMRTNGGCYCFERAGVGPSAVKAAHDMLPELLALRVEVARWRGTAANEMIREAVLRERELADDILMHAHHDVTPGWVCIPVGEWGEIERRLIRARTSQGEGTQS